MKKCNECKSLKHLTEFYLIEGKRRSAKCKLCIRLINSLNLPRIPRVVKDLPSGERVCSKCGIPQKLESFPIAEGRKLGRGTTCKSCLREYAKNKRLAKQSSSDS